MTAFRCYLESLNRSPHTIRLYVSTAERFLGAYPLTKQGVLDYLEGRKLDTKHWRSELTHLRALFDSLGLPRPGIKLGRAPRVPKASLTHEHVRKLLDVEPDTLLRSRDRAVLELFYGTGLRVSEVVALRVTDLSLPDVRVRPAKRGRPRILTLPPEAVPHVRHYLDLSRPALEPKTNALFVTKSGRAACKATLYRIVRKHGDTHPHALRRTLALGLLRNGASIPAIQYLLGHTSLAATDVYLNLDKSELRAAVDSLSAAVRSPIAD